MQSDRAVWAFAVMLTACAGSRHTSAPPAPVPAAPPASPPAQATEAAPVDVFAAQIKPILVEGCMPCHFPGGKMYDRLPFDDGSVVAAHPEGVLKRIKDAEKKERIERWLASR
jgi:hypothetical protein